MTRAPTRWPLVGALVLGTCFHPDDALPATVKRALSNANEAGAMPRWLDQALLWNDEKDGRPTTEAAIAAALATLEVRLGIGANLRDNARAFNFTTTLGLNVAASSFTLLAAIFL